MVWIHRAPPGIQNAEPILLSADLPVELRREIVEPSIGKPPLRVGVDLSESVEAGDSCRATRPPDPERADPDEHGRPDLLDALVEISNERIDVRAAPGVTTRIPLALAVLLPGLVV